MVQKPEVRPIRAGSEVYDAGRPGYPPELFDILTERCGLAPGCRVVEVGPGTGQATGPLLEAGASVFAIELGAEMAAMLEAKYLGRAIRIEVGAFEDVDLPDEEFDMVTAATSFHWVPPDVGLTRCSRLLRPGGSLALWWNYFGDPDRDDPFHDALQPLLRQRAPHLIADNITGIQAAGTHPYALDVAARVAEIDATEDFGPVEHQLISWTGTHTPAEVRRMFGSFSPWLALEPSIREPLLDAMERLAENEFGGTVERPYLTALYMATRR